MRPGGLIFPVPMTFSEPSRGHMARACLESVAYALKSNLAQAEAFADRIADEDGVRFLSVEELRQRVSEGEPAYLIDVRTSVREASAFGGRRTRVVEPRPVDMAEYRDLYEAWTAASRAIEEVEL